MKSELGSHIAVALAAVGLGVAVCIMCPEIILNNVRNKEQKEANLKDIHKK